MENLGYCNIKKELERLNPGIKFDMNDSGFATHIIYGTASVDNIILPEGYYCREDNTITNKHNTESGLYEYFLYSYDPDYFKVKHNPKPAKKSFWSKIFGR